MYWQDSVPKVLNIKLEKHSVRTVFANLTYEKREQNIIREYDKLKSTNVHDLNLFFYVAWHATNDILVKTVGTPVNRKIIDENENKGLSTERR